MASIFSTNSLQQRKHAWTIHLTKQQQPYKGLTVRRMTAAVISNSVVGHLILKKWWILMAVDQILVLIIGGWNAAAQRGEAVVLNWCFVLSQFTFFWAQLQFQRGPGQTGKCVTIQGSLYGQHCLCKNHWFHCATSRRCRQTLLTVYGYICHILSCYIMSVTFLDSEHISWVDPLAEVFTLGPFNKVVGVFKCVSHKS